MCGLAGYLAANIDNDARTHVLNNMLNTIRHRGPDGDGIWLDKNCPLGLGHVRLAIIDPERGVQPMLDAQQRFVIVFNGAIYNYLELRSELISRGCPIRSYSDTEVLLYAYQEWGQACVDRLVGMFAFAIWDTREKTLFCARDRIGIKPFYYYFDGNRLLFASEIKAILSDPAVKASVNPEGLQDYLTFQFCLNQKTLFKGIEKLEPGHCLTARYQGSTLKVQTRQYWDLQYNIDETHDERYFIDTLASLLDDSIRLHMRADVPLGAHLSGGLDSSAVVCMVSRMLGSGSCLNTFTGAFREGAQFDETGYARQVSAFARTQQNEIYIPAGEELPKVLPRLMYYMDEPLAGPGVIPQYYVSRLASEKVKVVLGGQGGDELFIGYARYMAAYLEKCLAGAIYQTSNQNRYAVTLESIVPNLPLLATYKPMLQMLWRDGLFDTPDRRYFRLLDRSEGMTQLFKPDIWATGGYSPLASMQQIFNRDGLHSLVNQMTYFDLKASLPALLHVEDRTSMAASIESRVPLLDHRIVEFMASIPPNIKFAGGRMKHLFKEAVRSAVPPVIFERKDKMGFPTPLTQWTKGVARDFVRDTLLSTRARQRGLYDTAAVEKALANEHEFGRVVWGLLCLELWHRIFIDRDMQPDGIG